MSEDDLYDRQQDEVAAIEAMYPGDVEVTNAGIPEFTISLYPQRGSSAGGAGGDGLRRNSADIVTFLKVLVRLPPKYPKVIPKMTIKDYKGLSAQEIDELNAEMKKTAEGSLGMEMLYQILHVAEEFLYSHQKKPTGSFHDEMLIRKKQLEEENLQMQLMFKERERLAIREEILRKQEELREEHRRRREQWRLGGGGGADASDSFEAPLDGSPTKNDQGQGLTFLLPIPPSSGAINMKPSMIANMSRRKRRSISCRRRRSNSEGSDSSQSEAQNDLVPLEFLCGRTVQQFYRGEVIGRGQRGSTVYAGISKNGALVAITEWRFQVPGTGLDRHKGQRSAKISENGNVNNVMTSESLIKQLQTFETESNFIQKLEHSNTLLYYGMKILPSADEPGVVYLYLTHEFVRGHSLKTFIQENDQSSHQSLSLMALPLLRHITCGVLEALKFLHDNNIAHRYLRDTSIFLDYGDEVKVSDYGIERKVFELHKSVNQQPDFNEHFPPSVGRGGKKGDIYRLGLIILSLLKGRYVEGPDIPQTIPGELQDFLKRCLSTLENNRWTSTELLEHPFLKMAINKRSSLGLADSPQPTKECDDENDEEGDAIAPLRVTSTSASVMPFITPGGQHSRLQNEFQVLEWLGKGGFGDVLKVRNKLDSRIYALKRIKLNPRNKQLNKKITREVKLLSQLNHENVVRYFNSWIETAEEADDTTEESATTVTTSTDLGGGGGNLAQTGGKKVANSNDKKETPSVRFQLDLKNLKQNSLGLVDNIEDLAPPMRDSEWSRSMSMAHEGHDADDADDSEDSSDEVDLFGTSFLRLTNDDDSDEAIVFENGSSETDGDGTTEESSRRSKLLEEKSENLEIEVKNVPPREVQFMYIQMEFCEKSTLRTAIDDRLFEDVDRAWRFFREIVEGLVHIHQQGMIHRDLKPVNIFLDSFDHVKIGDFGLATSSILPKITTTAESEVQPPPQLPAAPTPGPQSVDFPEESQTGQVGTALYVAPELIAKSTSKVAYNQKVDIYSLGIIFFEMFSRPLSTGMERLQVISGLRQPKIQFPGDFDLHLMPQVTHITSWLLDHDPSKRPTSLELLQSDYLPPPHLEEAELRDIFSRTLKNSQSKAYKFLIASCFLQQVTPVENYTYDMENTRCHSLRGFNFLHNLKLTVQKIFMSHGGLEISTPSLMPKSANLHECMQDTCVHMMCHSGTIVTLPHDLRIPFARYVGRHGLTHLRRFSIEKVFRERKVYGLHPRELVECAFDIVGGGGGPGGLFADAEILAIALEVMRELPWMRSKTPTIRLGHTKLLEGLLIHHGIDVKFHGMIKKTLAEIRVESSSSKSQIQTYLCSQGLPEHFISMLFSLMEVEGSLPKVTNILKSVTKRKSEAASLIKAGLHELEILMTHLDNLGLKCNVAIVPTMVFASHIYSGLLFQVVIANLRRRKNKITVDVIAAGGRYDSLIESFRSALALESELTMTNLSTSTSTSANAYQQQQQSGVGISISFDKLVAGFEVYEADKDSSGGGGGSSVLGCGGGGGGSMIMNGSMMHAVICSVGHHHSQSVTLAKEKLELMKELWTHGIKCCVLECSQTLEAAEEQCKEMGAQFMLILNEKEFFSSIRVKMWERDMFQERKMTKQEAIDLINKRVNSQFHHHHGAASEMSMSGGVGSGGGGLGLGLGGGGGGGVLGGGGGKECGGVGGGNSLGGGSESSSNLASGGGGGTGSSSTSASALSAMVNISFVMVQEREKLANWKKRYENQVMHHVTDVLPKLAKQQHVEVLGMDVNGSVVKTLASCLVSTDKAEFYKGVSDAIEKHPRQRKYLQHICDEIYELWFEKSASVIILYGLVDNSYRVML